ncbi:PRTRC system protein C [Ralstonia sp. UBA689]|uniref:PRTRC system protein C n=1 Tax=Ralstonia sp. UBA689 TaxID=1947373 RepID=UPI0025E905EE|nr:PRTRC system protein C [Ralstonia sp. UBA689]
MQTTQLTREFRYNGVRLADPSPNFTLEQVRDFYANTYAGILNADIEGPAVEGAQQVYTFRRAVGTKGNDLATLRQLIADDAVGGAPRVKLIPTSQLNHPVAKLLRQTTQRYRYGNNRTRSASLVPPSTALQVLA